MMIGFNGGLIGVARDTSAAASVPGVWTPREQLKARRANTWPLINADPYFANVSLLLRGDGTNGSTTFTDGSINNFSITANGAAQISTTQSKYGGASMYFNGSTSSYLSLPSNSAFTLDADFTIEWWSWKSSNGYYDGVIGSGSGSINFIELSNTRSVFMVVTSSGISEVVQYTYNPNDSTWHHYAATKSGSTLRLFIDGVQVASGQNTAPLNLSGGKIGGYVSYYYNGYIDDFRITKGVARYTANFTPPGAL